MKGQKRDNCNSIINKYIKKKEKKSKCEVRNIFKEFDDEEEARDQAFANEWEQGGVL